MKHVHSELMADYAADAAFEHRPWEFWQFRDKGLAHRPDEWQTLSGHPNWQVNTDYRRTPEANIQGRK